MSSIYYMTMFFTTLLFAAELVPVANLPLATLGLSRASGRRQLDSIAPDCEFLPASEISVPSNGKIIKLEQFCQGIKVDGIHIVEFVQDGQIVSVSGTALSHVEDDLPSVADASLVDIDLLLEEYGCEEVKYEEVIEYFNGVAVLVYKVDCWTAFDADVDGIHRWRMEFDAQTGDLLQPIVDAIDHHLPKNAAADRRMLGVEDLLDLDELLKAHDCDEILKSTSLIDILDVFYIVECRSGESVFRLELDAISGELIGKYDILKKTRRNLDLETMTGYGGNERTGQLTHESLKIERDGETCTYSSDNVDVVHNEFTENRSRTTPFSFPCADLPEQTDAINGAYSPLNDASAYGEVVYDMFNDWYDMEALPFKLRLHVHYGSNWENAMWDGSAMYFGDGQSRFHPLVSLGVTAHEVSHGVTEYAANLVYSDQSGGLNEAFSDMSAAAAEFYYWGETEYILGNKIAKGSGAMRYMCDPTSDGRSIDHVNQYTSGMDVHHSSGVFNKVFCELSNLENWGPRKTFNLFLTANKIYWDKNTNFQEAADLTMSAAGALEYEYEDICSSFLVVGLVPAGCSGEMEPTPSPVMMPTEACTMHNVELHTVEWAQEITWELEGVAGCSSDGQTYSDLQTYTHQCCVPPGQYTLSCEDSYGDGWHNSFLTINGVEYCQDFATGYVMTATVSFDDLSPLPTGSPVTVPTPAPTAAPVTSAPTLDPTPSPTTPSPTEACTMHTVELHTVEWAQEITWELEGVSGCSSDGQTYGDMEIYTHQCCVPHGQYTLSCEDSYGDGWHNGFLKINGVEYCRDFASGYVMTAAVSFDDLPSEPTTSPTSAPTFSPTAAPATSAPTFSPSTSPTTSPTSSPVEAQPCTTRTIRLFTLIYGEEIAWELMGVDGCSSGDAVFGNDGLYEFECCIPDGTYTLSCTDTWGDGWHMGYLDIEGQRYCRDFSGESMTVDVTFPAEDSSECKDSAPVHVCQMLKGRGWCDHVKPNEICSETCDQCTL